MHCAAASPSNGAVALLNKAKAPKAPRPNPSFAANTARFRSLAYCHPKSVSSIHGLSRPSFSDRDPIYSSPPPSPRMAGGLMLPRARSSDPDPDPDPDQSTDTNPGGDLLQLGLFIVFWYLFNISFNIYNKQVLKVYPYPLTITTFQFAVGTVLIFFMWSTNIYRRPNVSSSQLLTILPLAFIHTLGNLFTNVSLGKVAVSFTHTIKAMEPFFSVVLSAMFLGESPSLWVLSSLVPIVGGVALASLTEASFNWVGFWSAMASNVTNQARNVLSKKLMLKKEESLDNITLFSIITVMSFFMSAPLTLFFEGIKFTPLYVQSVGLDLTEIYVRSLLAGISFHAYQQISYMILAKVSPVTHSVANCVKRVAVIVSSVVFFKTHVTPINSLGTGVALAGVFLYSRLKRLQPKSD